MTLGTSKRIKIYAWDDDNTEWHDFSENLMYLKCQGRLNELLQLDVKLMGIDTDAEKLLLKDWNESEMQGIILLCVGTNFKKKFTIEQSKYNTDYTCNFNATISTGTIGYGQLKKRRLGSSEDWTYTNKDFSSIVDDIVEYDVSNDILDTSISDVNSVKTNVSFDRDVRINAINDICESANADWWLSFESIADNNIGTDTLNIASSKGSDKSATVSLVVSGSNQSCIATSKNKEVKNLVNDITILGYSAGVNQLSTNIFHATTDAKRTHTNGAIDSFLDGDISATATDIDVEDGSVFEGGGGVVVIDGEKIEYDSISGNTLETCTRGVGTTTAAPHKDEAEVLDFGANGTDTKFDVDDGSALKTGGNTPDDLYIGGERVDSISISTNEITCDRSITKAYAHGDGITVYPRDNGDGTDWLPDSPMTDSSIEKYGIQEKSLLDTSSQHKNDMDKKAQEIIESFKEPVDRISVRPIDPFNILDTHSVVLGDIVNVVDSQVGLNSNYRIVTIDITYNYGMFELEMEMTQGSLDYSRDLKEGFDFDYQRPTRFLADNIKEYSDWDGKKYEINATKCVIDVTDTLILLSQNGILIENTTSGGDFQIKSQEDLVLYFGSQTGNGGSNYGFFALRSYDNAEEYMRCDQDTDLTTFKTHDVELDNVNLRIRDNKELRFYDNGNYTGFEAPALSENSIYVLPTAHPGSDKYLKSDSGGTLTWDTPAGAGQNLWETIASDSGSTAANTTTDTLSILGGTNCSTAIAGDTLTINVTAGGDVFKTMNCPSGSDPVADSATDTLNFTGTTITITGNSGTDTIDFELNSTLKSNYDAAHTHISQSGASHTNINQDVTTTGTPGFAGILVDYIELNDEYVMCTHTSNPLNIYAMRADSGEHEAIYFFTRNAANNANTTRMVFYGHADTSSIRVINADFIMLSERHILGYDGNPGDQIYDLSPSPRTGQGLAFFNPGDALPVTQVQLYSSDGQLQVNSEEYGAGTAANDWFSIWRDSTHCLIDSGADDIWIKAATNVVRIVNSAVDADYLSLEHDGTDAKISTSAGDLDLTSVLDLNLYSGDDFYFRAGDDLKIRIGHADEAVHRFIIEKSSGGTDVLQISELGNILWPFTNTDYEMKPDTSNTSYIGTNIHYYYEMHADDFIEHSPKKLNIDSIQAIKRLKIEDKSSYPNEVLSIVNKETIIRDKNEREGYLVKKGELKAQDLKELNDEEIKDIQEKTKGIKLGSLVALLIMTNKKLIKRIESLENTTN